MYNVIKNLFIQYNINKNENLRYSKNQRNLVVWFSTIFRLF